MKVMAVAIQVVCWFDELGNLHPVRFRHENNVVPVQQVMHTTEEKLAGNRMKIFRCRSEINGSMREFELKYETQSCKWMLWRM